MGNRVCVFCGGAVAEKGKVEHVYSQWWAKMWRNRGPFYATVNGTSVLTRDGERRWQDTIQPLKLDVCGSWPGSANCNGRLGQLFEDKGKPAVESVWRHQAVLGLEQTRSFAAWWVKTLLLVDHPLTRNTFPGLDVARPNRLHTTKPGTNEPLLPLLDGPGLFPPDLTLWLAVADEEQGENALEDHRSVGLPTVGYGQLPPGQSHVMNAGPNLLQDRKRVLLQLLHHPYCEVAHPFERAGLAVRLWPDPPGHLDIGSLPPLSATGIDQFEHQFRQGGGVTHRTLAEVPLRLHMCRSPEAVPWPYCGCPD